MERTPTERSAESLDLFDSNLVRCSCCVSRRDCIVQLLCYTPVRLTAPVAQLDRTLAQRSIKPPDLFDSNMESCSSGVDRRGYQCDAKFKVALAELIEVTA